MPRVTERARRVKRYRKWFRSRMQLLMLGDMSNSSDSDENDMDTAVTLANLQITQTRYITRKSSYTKSTHVEFERYLGLDDVNFLLHFRLHKESFWKLHSFIKDFWQFHRRCGGLGEMYRPQAAVAHQLLIFLYVLGASGSDANYKKVGTRFKIGHGTIQLYVERCTKAVLSLLEADSVNWPDAADRKTIAKRIQAKYGFPNCIGFLDGTILPLEFKPSLYGEEYWHRKGGWAVHCLIICDDETHILDFLAGWPASVHDNRVWSNTEACKNYHIFFSRLQYLLADSAFTSGVHCISAFKKLRGVNTLPEDQELFNTLLARARIKVEHCIGLLKNRFPCLRNLRTKIKDVASMKNIIDKIRVCIVLHNMLVGSTYPKEWERRNEEDDEMVIDAAIDDADMEYEEGYVPLDVDNGGKYRRDEMMRYMIEWNNADA